MRVDDLVRMNVPIRTLQDPFGFICDHVAGKNVLNVGAAGGVQGYLPGNQDIWLHEKLIRTANEVVAVDIDKESIAYAKSHGYEMLNENCETMELDRKFDIIVMSDVIEHVNAPVTAIYNLSRHLAPGGKLFVTTPNGTSANVSLKVVLRATPNVFYDHMMVYYPEHFQAMCDRLGLQLSAVYMFDHKDRRTGGMRLRSAFAGLLSFFSPRLAGSQLCVIERN